MPKKPTQTFEEKVLDRLEEMNARLRALEIGHNEFTVAMHEVMQSVDAVKSVLDVATIVDISEPTEPPSDVEGLLAKFIEKKPKD